MISPTTGGCGRNRQFPVFSWGRISTRSKFVPARVQRGSRAFRNLRFQRCGNKRNFFLPLQITKQPVQTTVQGSEGFIDQDLRDFGKAEPLLHDPWGPTGRGSRGEAYAHVRSCYKPPVPDSSLNDIANRIGVMIV